MKHSTPTPRRREVPVTPLILQGRWKGGRFPGNHCFAANCRALSRAFSVKVPRLRHQPVVALFSTVERESEILDRLSPINDKIVALLLRIAAYHSRWVRPVEAWSPKTEFGSNQLSELIRYLFERFPTPTFFEAAWTKRRGSRVDWAAFDWYVHVAGGGSIRTAPGLPVTLNRRAAHELAAAPGDLLPRVALRWAQIRAAGAPARLVRALLGTIAGADFEENPLWATFFQKLGTDPTLGPAEVGPLVDYVRHRLREADGSFSLKGRTIQALVEATQRWHQDLAQQRYAQTYLRVAPADARWNSLPGVFALTDARDHETWEISELLGFQELFEEGRSMHHCVASYVNLCLSGSTSIWSLRIRRPERETGRVTIRIDVPSRTVVEARRVSNQAISRGEHRFIERWAHAHRLAVAESISLLGE